MPVLRSPSESLTWCSLMLSLTDVKATPPNPEPSLGGDVEL